MKRLLTVPAGLLLALPAFAQDPAVAAESAPALDPIVQKLIENLPKLAEMKWEAAHTLDVDGGDGTAKGTINMSFQDKKHFKCAIDITAAEKTADGAEGETQNIKATMVADGTWLWVNAPMLAMGGLPENVKVELAVFEEIIKLAPKMMGGMNPNPPEDLQDMLSGATKGVSFKEEGSTDAVKRFVFSGEGWSGWAKADAGTWFPMGFEASNDEGMKIAMNTTSFSKKESFAEGYFALNGVDVSTVMDLSPMIRMQLGALQGAGGDDDLEF
jgi:hypothetical protein